MKVWGNKLKIFIGLFLVLFVINIPFNVFALNSDYVFGDFKEERFWSSCPSKHIGENQFEGNVKYIADNDEGCFYFCINFKDRKLPKDSKDNITIVFTVENSENTYLFSVDHNGITDNSTQNTASAFDICYNFDKASCSRQGGNIYIAFELKDKADRKLLNTISCEYYCGNYSTQMLFENAQLDMYEPTTTKKSTSSKNAAAKADKSKVNNNNNNSNEMKTTVKNSEKSTKFSGSKTTSSKETYTKFSGNGIAEEGDYAAEEIQQNEDFEHNELAENSAQVQVYSEQMSSPSKAALICGAVILLAGIICTVAGIALHPKQEKEDKTQEEKEM